jgi:DksA/TraR C4-type zinc finger protein
MPRNCTVCAEPIPAKRLIVLPNARLCTACQGNNDVPELREASVLTRHLPLPKKISGPSRRTNVRLFRAADIHPSALSRRVISERGHDGLVRGGENHAKVWLSNGDIN